MAHRLATIQKADIIYVLGEGKVLEQGNHHELLKKKGVYYNMVSGYITRVQRIKLTRWNSATTKPSIDSKGLRLFVVWRFFAILIITDYCGQLSGDLLVLYSIPESSFNLIERQVNSSHHTTPLAAHKIAFCIPTHIHTLERDSSGWGPLDKNFCFIKHFCNIIAATHHYSRWKELKLVMVVYEQKHKRDQ